MDNTDYRILEYLQRDGRLSSQALAERTGLSTTPCWRRVRKLERDGVISGYVALLDPQRLGLEVTAIANVSLEDHHPDSVGEFDRLVRECPEILECFATSGQYDFMLKLICASIGDYERVLTEQLLRCKAVHTVNTSFVLRTTKDTTALPLPAA